MKLKDKLENQQFILL